MNRIECFQLVQLCVCLCVCVCVQARSCLYASTRLNPHDSDQNKNSAKFNSPWIHPSAIKILRIRTGVLSTSERPECIRLHHCFQNCPGGMPPYPLAQLWIHMNTGLATPLVCERERERERERFYLSIYLSIDAGFDTNSVPGSRGSQIFRRTPNSGRLGFRWDPCFFCQCVIKMHVDLCD